MDMQRVVRRKKTEELVDAAVFFQRLSGIDVANVPSKYGNSVEVARQLVCAGTEINLVWQYTDVLSIDTGRVELAGGAALTGKMPPRVLQDCKQVLCYVITLGGFEKLNSDDAIATYFFDTWGSAYVECAQAWLADYVRRELAQEGLERTHLWSPGQHQFELENQKPLFQLLAPEEIGCTLSNRLMMIPVKSVSGIMGVVEAGRENLLRPCDFCRFKPTCPASQRGCSVL